MTDPVADAGGYEFRRQDVGRAMLRFPANEGHVATALADLADCLKVWGAAPGLVDDVRIVLAEVLNNVEEHAYAGASGDPVTVHLEVARDGLHCVVEDRGSRFPSARLPGPDMPVGSPTAPETLPEGGFGWPIVRKLTREVRYVRESGTNRLAFRLGTRSDLPRDGLDNGT